MEAQDARATLAATARVRHRTRRALNPSWYANLVFGAYFAGTAVVAAVAPDWLAAAYGVAGLVTALTLVVRFHIRCERELGVESRAWDASATLFAALIAGVVVANALFDGDLGAAMPLYAAAAAVVGYALLWRDPYEAAVAVGLAAVATTILLVSPDEPGRWGNLGLGLVLLAVGAAGRAAWQRPRA